MQMFVYEMTQMMVARGDQVVFSSVQLSPGTEALAGQARRLQREGLGRRQLPLRTYGEFEKEVRLLRP